MKDLFVFGWTTGRDPGVYSLAKRRRTSKGKKAIIVDPDRRGFDASDRKAVSRYLETFQERRHSAKADAKVAGRRYKMNFPVIKSTTRSWTGRLLLVLAATAALTISMPSQVPEAAAADLDQCRNGPPLAPVGCTTKEEWVNGNANQTNAHWSENEFISYRMKFTDLTVGTHTVIIGYDILKGTKHALDYLGTYNATETTAYACAGIAGCTGAPTTFPVPTDTVTVTSNINPNTGLPIAQIPGVFSMWGGTITSASYVAYAGGEERQISITFTADVPNPVIAWGGHIAWIGDWGAGNSAVAISGSPYHMRLIELDGSGGNQDRALQNTAVIPSAAVFVKKEVFTAPPDPTNGAFTTFNFTATANFGMTSFGLVDDNEGPGVDTAGSQPIVQFGAENMITVSEIQQSGWTFLNVNCAETGLQDSTKNSVTPTANIIVQVGEIVTCTFQNSQLVPTAANASISGRVLLRDGTGLYGVVVLLTCPATGVNYAARTNPFGFYQFSEIPTGHAYFVIAKAKGKSFVSSVQSFTLSEDLTDVNLYLDPLE